ncbi:hypothetical protein NPIL_131821 [Nephila pilipes]|uniref:Uncharacterized protein n=1 Tax=Nephila pilipes TaxID=299642 RepID=A0A8X6QB76_NEPPI|nr:hypothetical protein NPIL_131821 [Nephila pilipes]
MPFPYFSRPPYNSLVENTVKEERQQRYGSKIQLTFPSPKIEPSSPSKGSVINKERNKRRIKNRDIVNHLSTQKFVVVYTANEMIHAGCLDAPISEAAILRYQPLLRKVRTQGPWGVEWRNGIL